MFFFFNKIIRITQFSKLATNCSSASPNTMIDRKCKSSISLTVDNLLHSLVRRRTKNFCNNTRNAGHDKAERSKKSWRLVEKGSDDYWNDARDSNSSPPRGVLKKKKKKIRGESKFYSTVPVFPRRKPLDGGARANERPIVRSIATYFRPRSALRACACVWSVRGAHTSRVRLFASWPTYLGDTFLLFAPQQRRFFLPSFAFPSPFLFLCLVQQQLFVVGSIIRPVDRKLTN